MGGATEIVSSGVRLRRSSFFLSFTLSKVNVYDKALRNTTLQEDSES
jgi:hypothetical protein